MADINRDSDEIELASPPRFAYGERVIARSMVRNDGTYNGFDVGEVLVHKGEIGYVININTFLQQFYIYAVDFVESGHRVGMRAMSYKYSNKTAWQVIRERFPVSLTFGLTSFFLTYLVCVPLGIAKALRHGKAFDLTSSIIVFAGYAIPPFALGLLLRATLCGVNDFGFDWFPVSGFTSEEYETLTAWEKFTGNGGCRLPEAAVNGQPLRSTFKKAADPYPKRGVGLLHLHPRSCTGDASRVCRAAATFKPAQWRAAFDLVRLEERRPRSKRKRA